MIADQGAMFLTLGQLISRYCPVDASACQTEPATRPRRVDPSHAAPAGQAWHVICGLLGSRIYSLDWQGTHCWLTAEKTPPIEFSRWLPYETPCKTLPHQKLKYDTRNYRRAAFEDVLARNIAWHPRRAAEQTLQGASIALGSYGTDLTFEEIWVDDVLIFQA